MFVTGLILGLVVGLGSVLIMNKEVDRNELQVTTKQVSGEEIKHEKVKIKKNVLTFKTKSKGAGEIETTIDIPYQRHIIQGGILLEDTTKFNLNYLYNYQNIICFGGGVIVSKNSFEGVSILAQIKI